MNCTCLFVQLILYNYFYRFAHFLHIVAPSDEMFEIMVPVVYWSIENIDLAEELKKNLLQHFPRDYKSHKSAYENSCDKIKRLINGMLFILCTKCVLCPSVNKQYILLCKFFWHLF